MARTTVGTDQVRDGSIIDADINASAAILGTKISPDFGAQNLVVNTAGLFFNYALGRLGLGTTTPSAKIEVVTDGNLSDRGILVTNYSGSARLVGRGARGTLAAPLALTTGAPIAQFAGRGWVGGITYPTWSAINGNFVLLASEPWTDTAQGTEFMWAVTPNTTEIATGVMWLLNNGNLNLGYSTPSKKLFIGCANGDGIRVESGGINLDMTVDAFGVKLAAQTNHTLRLATNDINRLVVGSNGYVGLGTATNGYLPAYPLEVAGDVNISTGSLYRINGAQISSSALSDGVPNTRLVSAGTGLSGGGNLSADITLSIANTAVTPLQYGGAAAVGQFTVDQQGRLTQAAAVSIQITESQVTSLGADLGLKFPYSGGILTGAIKAPQFTDTVDALGISGAALDINWSLGAVASITLTAACTFTFSGAVAGQTITLLLTQDATGGRTVTWPVIKWPGGTPPTLTATANKADIVTVFYDGVSYWGFTGGLNY